MGLTHYWKREIELSATKFRQAVSDCSKVFVSVEVPLAGPDGTGEPILSDDKIAFNGVNGQGCEPFVLERFQLPKYGFETRFNHCKTENLPYDIYVKCVLIIFKHYFSDYIEIKSDVTNEDWILSKNHCHFYLKYGLDFILS